MKNFFITLFMTAMAEATGGTQTEAPLTSEKLTALELEAEKAWVESTKHKFGTPEAKAAKENVWRIDAEIEAEKSAIRNSINAAKIAEAKNARLLLNTNQFAAYDNLLKVKATKGVTPEAIAEAQSAFDTAKELVDNELLAKYAGSRPAKTGVASEADTKKASENKAAILALYNAGGDHKSIEAAGYARSTVWHVLDKAFKAGEAVKR